MRRHTAPGSNRGLATEGFPGEVQRLGAGARLDLATVLRSADGALLAVGWRTIRAHLLPGLWIARFVSPTG
ncbi:hypothetical protein [Algihabitans albus]|uniref:hypothetical protein n=1 Tax=Algihabitans albus TaxID=2164067 RepID=UPI000E5CC8C0|nr:hypothetical protein [Algihabitans albus]